MDTVKADRKLIQIYALSRCNPQPVAINQDFRCPLFVGRKSTFNNQIAAEILERISEGEPLEAICRSDRTRFPAARTVCEWKNENEEFGSAYAQAREIGFDAIAADCLKIADESEGDTIETENGPKFNAEFAARSKIRIETRFRLLRAWSPAKYGDRIAIEDTTPAKAQSREEVLKTLRNSGLSVADIFGALTKPVEPVALEIESGQGAETGGAEAEGDDFSDVIES